jgi:hypothetical protein
VPHLHYPCLNFQAIKLVMVPAKWNDLASNSSATTESDLGYQIPVLQFFSILSFLYVLLFQRHGFPFAVHILGTLQA